MHPAVNFITEQVVGLIGGEVLSYLDDLIVRLLCVESVLQLFT